MSEENILLGKDLYNEQTQLQFYKKETIKNDSSSSRLDEDREDSEALISYLDEQ